MYFHHSFTEKPGGFIFGFVDASASVNLPNPTALYASNVFELSTKILSSGTFGFNSRNFRSFSAVGDTETNVISPPSFCISGLFFAIAFAKDQQNSHPKCRRYTTTSLSPVKGIGVSRFPSVFITVTFLNADASMVLPLMFATHALIVVVKLDPKASSFSSSSFVAKSTSHSTSSHSPADVFLFDAFVLISPPPKRPPPPPPLREGVVTLTALFLPRK
mmetsp:Transcript_1862/g.5632  ORF Transcript_1862/g.5632 Transcript_1862/m.5632 type:complete len:218 (+) Transcript_1862:450-1103(+)